MRIIVSVEDMINIRKELSGSVGFVPTMGALHKGHLSLMQKAKEQNDQVIVSVFVNPTQFLPGEDFEKYPRRIEADKKVCEIAGVDILFLPDTVEIYKEDEVSIKAPQKKGYILEGLKRPGHFDGVLQVVLKLLNITRPTHAYFGKKDAQQLILIEQMVKDLFLDTVIVPCDTVRESDGLALSSRNVYLSPQERNQALLLSRSLKVAAKRIMAGENGADAIKRAIFEVLAPLEIDYIEIVDRKLKPAQTIQKDNTIVLIAAKVGETRLIDNLWI